MNNTFIQGIIRRSNLNQLLIGLVILGIVIGGLAIAANFYYNLFNGPFDMSQRDLLNIKDVNSLKEYYVNLKGEDAVDTGFQYVTKNYGVETGHDTMVALLFDDQYLLVQIPGDFTESLTYTGALEPISSDIQRDVLNEIYSEIPELKGHFLPFMLDGNDTIKGGYIPLGIAVVTGLFGLWIILRAVSRMSDTEKHPIMKGLARFGDAHTTAEQIDYEMNQDHPTVGKKVHLTRNWLVFRQASSFSAAKLSDVVWIYKKVTQRRTNGIPTGKTYEALIFDRYGITMTIPGKEQEVGSVLEAVARQSPWAQVGYQKDWETKWKQQRAGFIAAVDQRKTDMQRS